MKQNRSISDVEKHTKEEIGIENHKCCNMSGDYMEVKKGEKAAKEDCEEESEEEDWEDWEWWTNPLEELGDMVDTFEIEGLKGKTILDVGTDCVKPLYIALKYEPHKIIGITLNKPRFAGNIAEDSRLLTKTEIHFYTCDFLDDIKLTKILKKAKVEDKFDFILICKTLHHLRTGKCRANERGGEHRHREDEKCCIYEFKEEEIFERFFQYGEKVIVYEWYDPNEKDDDKVRGRGGYFTIEEWNQILKHLSKNYKVEVFRPIRCHLTENKLEKLKEKLRQVDYICFSVEEK